MNFARRYGPEEIATRVGELARQIDADRREGPLVLVSILKGSSFLLADLARRMNGPLSCEYMSVRRAEGAHEVLQIDFSTSASVKGKNVLLLKDVVNTGVIESYLIEQLLGEGAASVRLAAILDKPQERRTAVAVDFTLFSAAGGKYVGYGMEYDGLHGHLPHIAEVLEEQ